MGSLSLTLPEGTITLHRKFPIVSQSELKKNFRLYARTTTEIDNNSRNPRTLHWARHVVADAKAIFTELDASKPSEEELDDVYIKISRHPAQIEHLENEARIYANQLMHLQGEIASAKPGFRHKHASVQVGSSRPQAVPSKSK